ncbi:M23 family metallopeptidase [Streptomyces sp. NPDC059605]|uniref:M23 family metallopeptidase n=1 Tax=unclassified Streptomyces TaxID=2593676 RepID=UPI0033A2F28E
MINRTRVSIGVVALALAGGTLGANAAMAESGTSTAPDTRIAAQSAGTTRVGASAAPRLFLPFPCGTKWRVSSGSSAHAPALDIDKGNAKAEGKTVQAAADGVVVFSTRFSKGSGNTIQIKHKGGYYTTYLHLKSRSVKKGDKVKRTTKIGTLGKDGPTANGHPHLHFEVAKGKKNADRWGGTDGGKHRSTAKLYPKTYKGTGKIWKDQVSHSCSAPKPTKWAPFKVVEPVSKRAWAGTKYKSYGKLEKGKVVMLACNHTRSPGGKLYRRLDNGSGADGRGAWVRSSSTYVKQLKGCTR